MHLLFNTFTSEDAHCEDGGTHGARRTKSDQNLKDSEHVEVLRRYEVGVVVAEATMHAGHPKTLPARLNKGALCSQSAPAVLVLKMSTTLHVYPW